MHTHWIGIDDERALALAQANDAELLLQDVAFYPLGHPVLNGGAVRVKSSAKTGIQNILASLVQRQGGEGED